MQPGLTPATRTNGSGLSQRPSLPQVTQMPDASFPVQVVSGVPVVVAPGEIDITNAAGLRAALLEAQAHANGTLVVDMAQTLYCDSAGLNVLVRAHKRAQADGGELLLVISGAAVLRIFAVTGIDHLIPNFPNLEQALAQTPAGPGFTSLPDAPPTGPGPTADPETLETL
jgi:stage II sporulation protein AA (anti-sigma F factor antagonist)